MITDDALREYADQLERNGFTVYEPKSNPSRYFLYSRFVGGQECFGYVQSDWYGGPGGPSGYSHAMPIRPSIEHGSSMFVEGVANALTVEAAKAVARPTNRNNLVGTQKNYRDKIDQLYIKRSKTGGQHEH